MSNIESGIYKEKAENLDNFSALLVPLFDGRVKAPITHLPTNWDLSCDECPYIPRREEMSFIKRRVLPHDRVIDRPGNHREELNGVKVRITPVILNPIIPNVKGIIDAYFLNHPVLGGFHLKTYGHKTFGDGKYVAVYVDKSGLRGYEGLGIDNPYGVQPGERIIFARLERFHNSTSKVLVSNFVDPEPATH